MIMDSQRLGFKLQSLDQRYSRRLQQNLQASGETYGDLETPGWTSLMRSQMSDRTKKANLDKTPVLIKQMDIYNKLNEAKNLQWSQQDQRKMIREKQNDKNQTRDTDYAKPRSLNQPKRSEQKKVIKQSPGRWNQITVHEHLYKQGQKMENKKMINKILDEEYKKEIFKFTPTINKKSIILAQSKFSRMKQNEGHIGKKDENTLRTEASDLKQKQDKEVERYRILNKTFYFLSEDKTLLTEESLQNTIAQLPLSCLKVIQSIVSRIYQGEKMEWLDFLQSFNDKSIQGKQGFYAIMTKWFARNEMERNKNTNLNSRE